VAGAPKEGLLMPGVPYPFGVNLAGFHESEKGVGEAVRCVERALRAATVPYVCNNLPDAGSVNGIQRGHFSKTNPFAVNLVCLGPEQMNEFALSFGTRWFAGRWNVGVWNWELSRFPVEWTPAFEFFDEIWAPSRFTQAAIAASSPIPVRHVPYAISLGAATGAQRDAYGIPSEAFVFLCAFDYQSIFERKNPLAAVRAFQRAFGKRQDVVLVLKTAHREGQRSEALLRAETDRWPNVIHLPRVLSRAEMSNLLQVCDALVSLHRSEGFGLHLAEAMSLGKPVIATDYSANVDFMTAENSLAVKFRLIEIADDHGPYRRGQVWAEPDIDHAAEQMRRATDRNFAKLVGNRARQTIEEQFSPEHVGRLITDALQELQRHPPRVDCRRLHLPAAALAARPVYRWWWQGTRGRFGPVPVARIRSIKRALQRCVPCEESACRRWLHSLCLGASLPTLRRLRQQLQWQALDAGGQVPAWRYRRWTARHEQIHAALNLESVPRIVTAPLGRLHEENGDFIALLHPGDRLAPNALAEVQRTLVGNPNADLLYSDEDEIDSSGIRCRPRFKPDWSPEFLLGTNYVGGLLVLRRDLLRRIGPVKSEYDLVLRASERAGQIVHIAKILCHRKAFAAVDHDLEALRTHLQRRGLDADVSPRPRAGTFQVRFRRPCPATVSVIIPNKDHAAMLEQCLSACLSRRCPAIEILIAENGSRETRTFDLYRRLEEPGGIRLLRWDRPFNYSAINNWAARQARGELLLFLNNDVEALHPDWLNRLTEWLLLPGVSIVGAKLLYRDGTLQHAGVAVGVRGVAGHTCQYLPANAPGYLHRLQIPHNVSAVTGACLLIKRDIFDELGGFDEDFQLSYGDIDLCLRALKAGYRNVWTPDAVLIHHESKTRGEDDTAGRWQRLQSEIERFRQRWAEWLTTGDPYVGPHFRRDRTDFCLT
jgi:GT2 family glycosyltransferase/glycosyltransferase involved in cell wall biosynthesis